MRMDVSRASACLLVSLAALATVGRSAGAAAPSAQQALKLRPIQRDADIAQPSDEEAAGCKIFARKIGNGVGWIVEDPNGLTLRKYLDTNGDNVVDLWSYFKNGLEVYRDVDSDFDGKADQYRWFHTAGSRWGLDKDQDGAIDRWKVISAEEVTAEAVAALAERDANRLARLVLTAEEIKTLGLGAEKAESLGKKIEAVASGLRNLGRQKTVEPDAKWVQFSATQPGIVPAGTDGSTKDLEVYENVAAIVETGGKHDQVQIGTLVRVDNAWRMIDLPQTAAGQADAGTPGFFFAASLVRRESGTTGPAGAAQELLGQLEKLDGAAEKAQSPEEKTRYNVERADLLERIADSSKQPGDRAMWVRQLADMIGAAVQQGTYPEGPKRLESLLKKLQGSDADRDLAAYVRFRQLTADYVLKVQTPKAPFAEVQEQWLKSLKQYAIDYPTSPDAAEALLQIAIAQEFAGEEEAAKDSYVQIVQRFADSAAAKKAAGARARLDSVGKTVQLSGKDVNGSPVDLSRYRGRVVLIQYWATWCQPALTDMPLLKELVKKYGAKFQVVGVNLDANAKTLQDYLAENPLPWAQIFEQGGLDSGPANQLGVLTLPTMILVDQQGKVVNRNVQTGGLEDELKRLIR